MNPGERCKCIHWTTTALFCRTEIFQIKSWNKNVKLKKKKKQKTKTWTSQVSQWWRICLPMHDIRVPSLIREDPTYSRVTKSVSHKYWVRTTEPMWCNCWSLHALEPVLRNEKPLQWEACVPQLERRRCSPQLEKVQAVTKT